MISEQKRIFILLTAVLALSVFLRVVNLDRQGVFLFDEATFIQRATEITRMTVVKNSINIILPHYLDSKPLWLMTVAFLLKISHGRIILPVYLSALFGVFTVLMTYIVAKRLYRSAPIGLLSAFLLAISPYHLFYSRLALPESAVVFWTMTCVYAYLIGMGRGWRGSLGAGVCFALAILTGRFRAGLVPVFILMLEFFGRFFYNVAVQKERWRYPLFLFGGLAVLLFYHYLGESLGFLGIYVQPYLQGLFSNIAKHGVWLEDWLSLLTFPFYLWRIEGPVICVVLLAGFVFIRHKNSTVFPMTVIVVQLLAGALVDEKAARGLVVVLPFIAMATAVTAINTLEWVQNRPRRRVCAALLMISLVTVSVPRLSAIVLFDSGIPEGIAAVKQFKPVPKILSSNSPVVNVYDHTLKVHLLQHESIEAMQELYHQGYTAVWIDPMKYIANTRSREWMDARQTKAVSRLQDHCRPVAEIAHLDGILFELFLYEHTFRSLSRTLKVLRQPGSDKGKIKIYDLTVCREVLGIDP